HPGSKWLGKNFIAQRADRLPDSLEWRNRRPRTALRPDRLARAAQTDWPGQLVRAADDVRVRAGAPNGRQRQIRDDRLLGTRRAIGPRPRNAHPQTNRMRIPRRAAVGVSFAG